MSRLALADWLVMMAYLGGIIAYGLSFGKEQRTTRDYFLGSRNISWWAVGFSIVATETSALTFIGVPALAYGSDLSFIQIIFGYVIARLILAAVLVPHYFRGDIYSPYQLLAEAFGSGAGRTAAVLFLIAGTLAAGVRVYVTCIPIQLMLGLEESQILWAILLFVVLSWIYTYVGGVKAVIWTDAVQFVLFTLGGVFALWFIPQCVEGGWSGAWRTAGAAGKLRWLNFGGGWDGWLAMPFNIWMGLVGATFQVLFSHGADQLIVQRIVTCRSVADGRKALLLSAAIILPLFALFLLTGTMLWVYDQQHPMAIPEVRPGVTRNDYIFPIFILTRVPAVLRGFLIVAVLSAAMSSVSSALAALASVSSLDLRRAGAARGEPSLRSSRWATAFWALMLIGVALATQNSKSVLNTAFSLSGLTSGALLAGLILSLGWRSGSGMAVMIGMAGSFLFMVTLDLRWREQIAWPWYTMIGTAVALAVSLAANVFFHPAARVNDLTRTKAGARDHDQAIR